MRQVTRFNICTQKILQMKWFKTFLNDIFIRAAQCNPPALFMDH